MAIPADTSVEPAPDPDVPNAAPIRLESTHDPTTADHRSRRLGLDHVGLQWREAGRGLRAHLDRSGSLGPDNHGGPRGRRHDHDHPDHQFRGIADHRARHIPQRLPGGRAHHHGYHHHLVPGRGTTRAGAAGELSDHGLSLSAGRGPV